MERIYESSHGRASADPNQHYTCRRRSIPVVQWNLKYSGENNGSMSLNEFLSRVKFHMRARHVSEVELLDSAYDLFSGSALNWYEANFHRFNSWQSLESALKFQFLPYDYDFYLYKEIEDRTQGESERIGIYIAVMQNMFNRLSYPVSERQRLTVILRNLHPEYTNALCFQPISTMDQLLNVGTHIEANRNRMKRFKPPPTQRNSLLEPSLAFQSRTPKINTCEYRSSDEELADLNINMIQRSNGTKCVREKRQYRCYNCGQMDHTYKECKEPKYSKSSCEICGTRESMLSGCRKCLTEKITILQRRLSEQEKIKNKPEVEKNGNEQAEME